VQDFIVSFLDFELTLDDRTREVYLLINEVLSTIDPEAGNNQFLIDQLIALKESVLDKNDVRAIVVSIQDTLNTQNLTLSTTETQNINAVIEILQDKSVSAALG
jgi:arginine deiminase